MGRYFYLQLKRSLRVLPFVLAALLTAMVCIGLLANGLWKANLDSDQKQRFKIAITGDTSGEYVQMGLMAMQTFDDSRFAMDMFELPLEEAEQMLRRGEISAYVILPENFIERALTGDMDTVTYVTHTGSETVVSMFKNELTKMVTKLVVYSQKGVYAVEQAAGENGVSEPWKHMDPLAMEYAELIFSRAKICTVETLGLSGGLDIPSYYLCSLLVFLLLFIGVTFITVGVKEDASLDRLLASKGCGGTEQVLCELGAHLTVLLAVAAVLIVFLVAGAQLLKNMITLPLLPLFLRLLAVVLMAGAFNMLVFELANNVISAALLHFFVCIGQCYVAGCFYPVYALPESLQKISGWLPAGMAREFLAGCFVYEFRPLQLTGILIYTGLFAVLTLLLRRRKILVYLR